MNKDIKRIQDRLLFMAKTIANILERNNIPHSMVYGTFLGAIRHKGFIPWDDDFDFCIFDEFYEDAMKCLAKELPSELFLESDETEPLYFHAWNHIKDTKTEAYNLGYPHDNFYAHKGLSIDLYRMKRQRMEEVPHEVDRQGEIYLEKRRSKGLISDEELARRIEYFKHTEERFKKKFPNEDETSLKREVYANTYTSLFCVEIEDFFPLKRYTFEDTAFYGPNNYDKVLTHWFGNNYMELPPEDKRRNHFEEVRFFE